MSVHNSSVDTFEAKIGRLFSQISMSFRIVILVKFEVKRPKKETLTTIFLS